MSFHSYASLRCFFFYQCYGDHRDLHSFPTRRSSDLLLAAPRGSRSGDGVALVRLRAVRRGAPPDERRAADRKSTRLNSSHANISYAVFCLKKKKKDQHADLAIVSLHTLVCGTSRLMT